MLPPASVPVPATWRDLLEELAPVFTRRSTHRLFVVLACGMILADRSTVVGMAAAAGFYQAVVGFILVVLSNWVVRRINPDRALF